MSFYTQYPRMAITIRQYKHKKSREGAVQSKISDAKTNCKFEITETHKKVYSPQKNRLNNSGSSVKFLGRHTRHIYFGKTEQRLGIPRAIPNYVYIFEYSCLPK